MNKKAISSWEVLRGLSLAIFFGGLALIGYWIFGGEEALASKSEAQQMLWPLGLGMLLAGLLTGTLSAFLEKREEKDAPVWFYPLIAALLTFCGLGIAYIFLGVWPVGEKSVMLVDMHHQYAPLLAKLRQMLLGGESFLYSFEFGMGASVLPALAYYLASPLNLLLVLFPEHLLTEGIFVITILKNMLIAAGAALCLQYVYRRRSPLVVAVSLMYSMMMYVLAYSWNIMWLDGVMALPLVVMGFEYMMRKGKYLPYVLSLAYALYTNYYIAFMLCVFLVLYYFAFLTREQRAAELNRKSLVRFTLGSLLGGGLAMFLVLPTFLALGQTSAAGAKLPDMGTYFDMFNLLGRHLYDVSPTIRSANLPNVYCGVAVMLLVPLFALNSGITRRRRVTYLVLLGVMTVSLFINQPNLLWHGLHAPNDLPYRFSFIYCFVLLLMSYETLLNLRSLRMTHLLGSLGAVVAYLMVEERFGNKEAYDFGTIYTTLLLLVVYAALVWFMSQKETRRRVGAMLLLTVVTLELTLNASQVLIRLNNQEYNTAHDNYVDNVNATGRDMAVAAMKLQANDEAFARMEFLPRHTCMDTALYQYPGITSFASSNSYRNTRLMGALGYAVNGVNSYMYRSFAPMTDSLLGIRFVALQSQISGHAQLTQVDSVTATDETGKAVTYYIYENDTALPLAWRANAAVKDWASLYYNPMTSINSLYTAMTGDKNQVLVPMPISVDNDVLGEANVKSEHGFYFDPSGSETVEFAAAADIDGQYYIYVDCRSADSITARQGSNSWSVSTNEPYFIDAGTLSAGDTFSVSLTSDAACSGNVFILRLDSVVFNRTIEALKADGLQITEFSDTEIIGTVNASAAGTMVTTIPYDAGWTVTVDGEEVAVYPLDIADPVEYGAKDTSRETGAWLGFDIPAGAHTVEITFRTKGLIPGILLSIVSLGLLIALVLVTGRRAALVQNTPLAWALSTDDVDPGDPYALPAAPVAEEPVVEEPVAEVPLMPEEPAEQPEKEESAE